MAALNNQSAHELKTEVGRLFFTGDLHGEHPICRFNDTDFPKGRLLTKDDYVVIAGEVGTPSECPESCEDAEKLDWLESQPWTTLFVDGNHDNFDALDSLPEEEWHGGMVHKLRPSVIHLMRGYLFEVAGRSLLAFGGAVSIDKVFRVEGIDWWPQEVPSPEEQARLLQTLDDCDWRVDIVVTHCAPMNFVTNLGLTLIEDSVTRFLFESVYKHPLNYGHWYFGHYHEDKELPHYGATALLRKIVEAK